MRRMQKVKRGKKPVLCRSRKRFPPPPSSLRDGRCAIVLDERLLFRTNESAFVGTKRKLVDECDLWAVVSLPGGVFSTAGADVKTNLLVFTKATR